MLAGRRNCRIPGGGDNGFDERVIGPAPPLPAVVGALHGFERAGEALTAAVDIAIVRDIVESGHSRQRDIDFARRAPDLEVPGPVVDAGGQVVGIHDLGERALCIEVGNDNAGMNFVAVFQCHADRLAIPDQNTRDACTGAYLPARFPQRAGDGIGDRPHTAPGQPPGPYAAINISHDVMQQDVGGTGGVYAQRGADNPRCSHCRLDQIVLEVVLEKIRGTHGEKTYVFIHFRLAESPQLLAQEQQFGNIPRPERCGIGGRAHQRLAYELGVTSKISLEPRHGISIMGRVPAQFQIAGLIGRIVDQRGVTIVTEVDRTKIRHQQQPVAGEIQVAVNGLAHHAANIGTVRVMPTLVQLPRDRGTTDVVILLDHQHLEPGSRKVSCRRQAIVAGTNDNCVIVVQDRISLAALRPGLPLKSPPGCVPAPHRYRPASGVEYCAAS